MSTRTPPPPNVVALLIVALCMPYGEPWSEGLHRLVKKICARIGLECVRADDRYGESLPLVVSGLISESWVVICDMTGCIPNVMYEIGLAKAYGKRVIPITQTPEDVPSDLRELRFIEYKWTAEGASALEDELDSWLRDLLKSTEEA